jgi:hypothetical protein
MSTGARRPVISGAGEMDGPGEEERPEDERPEDAQEAGDQGGTGAARGDPADAPADEGAGTTSARAAGATEAERRIEEILSAAELRDKQADVRDSEAYRRDMAANLDAFVRSIDDDDAYRARSRAAKDRAQARADRVASKLDRHLLTGLSPNADERREAASSTGQDATKGDTGDDGEGEGSS